MPLKGFEGGKEGGEEGGRVTVEKSNLLYHDWVLRHGGGTAPKPDLVVAFNSGAYTGGKEGGEGGKERGRNGRMKAGRDVGMM